MKTLFAACLVLTSCRPTVQGYLDAHRQELGSLVQRVSAVQAELGTTPAFDAPFAAIESAALAVVPAEDFDALRTEPDGQYFHQPDAASGRPRLHTALGYVAAALRNAPIPTSERAELERLEHSADELRALRYVGVVQTTDWHEPSGLAPREWRARVLVWDLAARRWHGAFSMHLVDRSAYSHGNVWVSSRGTRSADITADQQNRIFAGHFNMAISGALATGSSAELELRSGQLTPLQRPVMAPVQPEFMAHPVRRALR